MLCLLQASHLVPLPSLAPLFCLQREQTPQWRHLCGQSHIPHRCDHPGQRWLLRHGKGCTQPCCQGLATSGWGATSMWHGTRSRQQEALSMQNCLSLHDLTGHPLMLCLAVCGFLASLAWDLEHQGSLGTALPVELWALLSMEEQRTLPAEPPAMWKALGVCCFCSPSLSLGLSFLLAFPGQW